MTLLQAIFMGVVQGLTEFLPVSSSGHLALFKNVFHINTDTGLLFDVMLHIGTLIAVCLVYRHDIWKMIEAIGGMGSDLVHNARIFWQNKGEEQKEPYMHVIRNSYRKMVVLIFMSTIPTALLGLTTKQLTEAAANMLLIPGIGLIITAIVLFVSDHLPEGDKLPKKVTYTNAFVIGICQGIATLPGISRSGITVTACIAGGFKRNFAVKYSFLMSIPAILGSLILELMSLHTVTVATSQVGYYFIGMLIAAVIGFICIQTMLIIVKNKKFTYFAIYCLFIGIVSVGGYFYC